MIERKYFLFAFLHLIILVICTFVAARSPETLGFTWILILFSGSVVTLAGFAARSIHLKAIGATAVLMILGLIATFTLLPNGPLHGPVQIFGLIFGYAILALLALFDLARKDITKRRGQLTFSIGAGFHATLAFAVPLSFSAILKPSGSLEFAAFLIFVVTIGSGILFDYVCCLKRLEELADAPDSPS